MSKVLLLEYARCITCRNAKKWLDENGVEYIDRPIAAENPSYEELKQWVKRSGLPLRRFFNTSGQLYRNLGLKDKLDNMTEEEQLRLLASDGLLVKRPLLVGDDFVIPGFKMADWSRALGLEK